MGGWRLVDALRDLFRTMCLTTEEASLNQDPREADLKRRIADNWTELQRSHGVSERLRAELRACLNDLDRVGLNNALESHARRVAVLKEADRALQNALEALRTARVMDNANEGIAAVAAEVPELERVFVEGQVDAARNAEWIVQVQKYGGENDVSEASEHAEDVRAKALVDLMASLPQAPTHAPPAVSRMPAVPSARARADRAARPGSLALPV